MSFATLLLSERNDFISKKNQGKIFEDNFKKSIPDYCWVKRLQDSVGTWGGNSNLRFSNNNECDFLVFSKNTHKLFAFELKSTEGTSLTFWREDFEEKEKKQTFMIKKNQILGLAEMSKFDIYAGFLINFRGEDNNTYFIHINDFLNLTKDMDKKSVNERDILSIKNIKVENYKLKTNYRYNIDKLFCDILTGTYS